MGDTIEEGEDDDEDDNQDKEEGKLGKRLSNKNIFDIANFADEEDD